MKLPTSKIIYLEIVPVSLINALNGLVLHLCLTSSHLKFPKKVPTMTIFCFALDREISFMI